MRSVLAIAPVLVLIGCQGPKGDPGPMGVAGPSGMNGKDGTNGAAGEPGNTPDGGVPPTTTSCSPTQAFCEGSRLWFCTKSGADAYGGGDCTVIYGTASTARNPYICSATGCSPGQSACCRPTSSTCDWNLGGTFATTGSNLTPVAGTSCNPPLAVPTACPANVGTFTSYVIQTQAPAANMCVATTNFFQFTIPRTMLAAGQTVTMPQAGVNVQLTSTSDPTKTCSAWTGTMTWNSDVPNWSITFGLTCSEATKTGVTVTGTMHGTL